MVVPLGPGKFYGSSLPRPRIYTDVKLNDQRVDPPLPVLDPLLSWAEEAHWSMGGLSFNRLRLQGRIEGNIQKLKKEKEKILKSQKKIQSSTPSYQSQEKSKSSITGRKRVDSPPPAPILNKRRLRSMFFDEDDNGGARKKRRRLVRKLGDDFEMVASESGGVKEGVGLRTRSRRSMVLPEEEDEIESDEGKKSKKQEKSEKSNQGRGSVSPKNVSKRSGEKGSGSSPNGTRSSPRLKQK